ARQFIACFLQQVAHHALDLCHLGWREHYFPAPDRICFLLLAIAAERGVGIAQRSLSVLLDAVVVEIMFNERGQACQRFMRLLNHVLIMDFHIIAAQALPILAALAYDPTPEDRGSEQAAFLVPWQRFDPADAIKGNGHIATIAN